MLVSTGLGFFRGLQQDIAASLSTGRLMTFVMSIEGLPGLPGCKPSLESVLSDPLEGTPLGSHSLDAHLDGGGLPWFGWGRNWHSRKDSGTGLM